MIADLMMMEKKGLKIVVEGAQVVLQEASLLVKKTAQCLLLEKKIQLGQLV